MERDHEVVINVLEANVDLVALERLRNVIREQGLEILMHQARIAQLESLLGDVIDDELDSTPVPPTKKPLKIKRSKR